MTYSIMQIGDVKHIFLKGQQHPNWKGEVVGRHALHTWIKRERGPATHCSIDPSQQAKRYEWSNISHKYQRSLEDFRPLCPSCHRKYDFTEETRKKISASLIGQQRAAVRVEQLDNLGRVIRVWNCIKDVEREIGIIRTSISNVLRGGAKTAGGFVWRYAP